MVRLKADTTFTRRRRSGPFQPSALPRRMHIRSRDRDRDPPPSAAAAPAAVAASAYAPSELRRDRLSAGSTCSAIRDSVCPTSLSARRYRRGEFHRAEKRAIARIRAAPLMTSEEPRSGSGAKLLADRNSSRQLAERNNRSLRESRSHGVAREVLRYHSPRYR